MRLYLEGEQRIRLQARGEGLDVTSSDASVHFSPLHMLAASLATCTLAVLTGYARQTGIPHDDIEIEVEWEYVDAPFRVDTFEMTLHWPELPEARSAAALRVAEHCTVENTLKRGARVNTRLSE